MLLADQLVQLEIPLIFLRGALVGKSHPVVHNACAGWIGVAWLEKLRDGTESGRVDHVQLAVEREGIANKTAIAVGPRGCGVINLALKHRSTKAVGTHLWSQESGKISITLSRSWYCRDRNTCRRGAG